MNETIKNFTPLIIMAVIGIVITFVIVIMMVSIVLILDNQPEINSVDYWVIVDLKDQEPLYPPLTEKEKNDGFMGREVIPEECNIEFSFNSNYLDMEKVNEKLNECLRNLT